MEDFKYTIGAELEFYIFNESGEVIADLKSGKFPQKRYKILAEYQDLVANFKSNFISFNIEEENGPGQFEAHFDPQDNYKNLADNVAQFKQQAIDFAIENNCEISFAAKPLADYTGSGLHIHLSSEVFDPLGFQENEAVMLPQNSKNNEHLLWAIGGCLARIHSDLEIFLPSEMSKSRIKPWLNAPTKICWGNNNRSVAVRIPDSKPKRFEHRVAGSDSNISQVCSAVIEAAIYGITNKIDAGEPVFGNAWDEKYKYASIV